MMSLCCDVLKALQGKTLVTAESLTGGGIGAALTQVSGSSYTNWVKENILGVPGEILAQDGAVSLRTAEHLASGVRALLKADVAVAVTGLAGPGGDEFGHSVGTVFIGYQDAAHSDAREYHFSGDREAVRNQTIEAALRLVLEHQK